MFHNHTTFAWYRVEQDKQIKNKCLGLANLLKKNQFAIYSGYISSLLMVEVFAMTVNGS